MGCLTWFVVPIVMAIVVVVLTPITDEAAVSGLIGPIAGFAVWAMLLQRIETWREERQRSKRGDE